MDDPTFLKWTGTEASAEKLVDEVDAKDQEVLSLRRRYATGKIRHEEADTMFGEGSSWLDLDTITNALTLKPGDKIQRTDEGWEIIE